jgi:regulatory protein
MCPAAGGQASPRRVAMDCLARREHSVAELRRKLAGKDFTPEEIDAALARLQQDGLVSDARFTEAFVNSRHRRGQGPAKVRAELQQRGVAGELITAVLASVDWQGAAHAAREKKFGPEIPDNFAAKARQARFLQARGFTAEQISTALAGGWEQD